MALVHEFDEASASNHMRLMKNWWRCIDDQASGLLNLERTWRSRIL